jgi:endo-1,4-beta-xylanase
MVFFSRLALGFSLAAGALALPANISDKRDLHARQQAAITSSQTGTYDGYYYSFWTNGAGTVTYDNTGAGAYSVNWSNANGGDFTAGVGWNPGSAR